MSLTTLIITIAAFVLTGGITLGIILATRQAQPKQRPLASPELPPLDPRLAQGINYKSEYRAKSKNNPASLTITADFTFPAPISFKTESKLDRFGKTIGLAGEVQTGDAAFDDAIYVDSPYPEYATRMLADSDNRRALRRCFAAVPNLAKMECRPDRTRFTISPADSKIPSPELAAELIAALPGLKQAVSRLEIRRNAFRERIGPAVIIATAALGLLGIIAMAIGLAAFESLDSAIFIPGLLGGLAATGVWTLLSFLVLRGRSGALLPFLLALTIGLFDFSMLGIGAVHIANGISATAPVETHRVPVTGKHISRGKNSTSYYLEIQPWREGLDTSLHVSSSWYDAYEAGDSIGIDSRMGGLGYELLLDYHE